MIEIKITFFVLGTFFGIENSTIFSEKTIVNIDPETKTLNIKLENLFTIIKSKQDSVNVAKELTKILKDSHQLLVEIKNAPSKRHQFYISETGTLNTEITVQYSGSEDLEILGVGTDPEGNYSIINIPQWNISTKDGQLDGNYWNFAPDQALTFSLEAFKDIPEQYKESKRSLLPLWQQLQD